MNILSLFDGISAGRLALHRSGIVVKNYYRSEIDKFANKVAMHHFPGDIQLGDVTKWREWDIDWSSIDMLIGGSPCQGFSVAGKRAGTKAVLDDQEVIVTDRETYLDMKQKGAEFLSQSHLFWEYVLILDHIKQHNPNVKFLLENVKMKKELLQMIDGALGVESVVINSALVSAQNRVRHYWCNWGVAQPEDKGILLRDILEDGFVDRDKSYCIDASYFKGGNPDQYFNKSRRQLVFGGAIRGRYNEDGSTSQRLECNDQEKTNALTTVQKDNVVVYRPCERVKDGNIGHVANATDINGHDILKRVYGDGGKSATLNANSGGNSEPKVTSDSIQYRKLTPTECARLQTFPDGWCESVVSNSQSYKAYGNSWTVDVISHIFSCIKN